MRQFIDPQLILNEQDATGVGLSFNCRDFKHIMVAVSGAANSTLTFKFQGSIGTSASSPDAPAFASAQSITNHWDYVAAYDLQSPGSVITGDTGVSLNNDTVANNTRLYVINTDGLSWFNIEVTSWTDGSVSAFVAGYSD